jgi:hypothetical protein
VPRARTIWRIVLAVGVVLVALAIGGAIYAGHVFRSTSEATTTARLRVTLAAHREEFLEDQRFLASLPIFAPGSGNRDAGPLIGPRVRWKMAAGTPNPGLVPGMTLNAIIEKLGDDWMRAGPDVWSGIDFGWMAQLAEYDYWDVDRNAVPPEQDSWSDTEPDSRDLWAWSKLRIAKGVHEHALAPALAEVQELARLCLTVERFPTQLAGIAMLRQARKAAEREAPTLSSRTADLETTVRMLRAISAARGFARLETPASYERDFAEVFVGRCSALHDGLRTAVLVRAQLGDARSADYQRIERLLAASPDCRLAAVRQRWARRDEEGSSKPKHWWEEILMRRTGEVMLSILALDWFSPYEKSAP